jgi:hypothetical protein
MEDGVEIDGINPKVEKIIHFLDNATQVTALEVPDGWFFTPFLYIRGIIRGVAIGESIRKYLIKNGILDPKRCCHRDL